MGESPQSGSDLAKRLRDRGYRLTAQRQLVMDAVRALSHATPESILARARAVEPNLNLSTVYRVLAVLQEVGLVTHAHIGTGSPAYHWADAPPHIHLVCVDCGTVTSAPIEVGERFSQDVAQAAGFQADVRHAAVYGRCARCAGDPSGIG
ncbi:MAG: Fur family transcriptional regulator [Candidatus Nanopelagicales bacterium]|nr:Fur family transcriptional regulator [Candidatus Nanopelagicales bacterium]MDZ4249045.1 Fur family transcriptional regulator [Candidatus Nanopelagicales bacterium]